MGRRPQTVGSGSENPLHRLVGIIDFNGRPLGWRRHLGRAKRPGALARYRVPVVDRTRRDVHYERRHAARTAWIGGVFGVLGSAAFALVSHLLGQ